QLALVGLNHRTAPVEIRERLAFRSEALPDALASLVGREQVNEALILSTCNRVEVVAESSDDGLIREFLCEFHQIPHDSISKHLYSFRNVDVIRHIFRVTASLDSMVLGEPPFPRSSLRTGRSSVPSSWRRYSKALRFHLNTSQTIWPEPISSSPRRERRTSSSERTWPNRLFTAGRTGPCFSSILQCRATSIQG